MNIPCKPGDIVRFYEINSRKVKLGIVLDVDWSWNDLFIHNEKNDKKIGMIKILCMGKIKSATTMEVREVIKL